MYTIYYSVLRLYYICFLSTALCMYCISLFASREMENQNLGRGCVLGIVVRLGDYVAVQEPLMGS